MIRARIKGRLGNQLFIYGFMRYLCEKYNQTALLYDRTDENDDLWHSHLNRFKLHETVKFTKNAEDVLNMGVTRKALFVWDRMNCILENSARKTHIRQVKNMSLYTKKGLIILSDGVCELPDRIPGEVFCDGYFQSDYYLNPIREKLLEEIIPVDEYTEDEKDYLAGLEECESVCVTIRLGDYLGNTTHQICTKKYYLDAMDRMREMYPNCVFYIFSDDVAMARKVFDFRYPVIFDNGKSRDSVSLKIMSHCRHFIISNSSFSWWAQYLCENRDKTVISPDKWFAKDIPCDIMQENWMKIKC